MLTANELRIGNYYLQDMINGCCEQIAVEDIANLIDDPLDDFYQPIPITEEWLIKFGGIDNVYTIEIGQLQFTWASRIIATGERCSWSCEQYPHIQYVHQLQNLYFALTNEELICN